MGIKDERSLIIALNWFVCGSMLLAGWPLLMMGIGAAYHPNASTSPYVKSLLGIWPVAFLLTLILCLTTSTIANNSSPRNASQLSAFVYLGLIGFSTAVLIFTEPVPDYSVQSINDGATSYRVPSEYVWGGGNNGNSLSLWMCTDDLKGKYARSINCQSSKVELSNSLPASSFAKGIYPYFFEESDEFGLDEEKVVLKAGSEQHLLSSSNGLKSYSIQTLWSDSDLQSPERNKHTESSVYLQINAQNEVLRFVLCTQSIGLRNTTCKHVVATSQGVLKYETSGPTNFDPARWQQKENDILALIAQWKV